MADSKLTYDEVKLAAIRIRNKGLAPTVENVYNMLDGEPEQKADIDKFLQQWFKEEADSEQAAAVNDVSTEELLEQKMADLEQSLALVRATLESTTDAIVVVDFMGNLVDYNRGFREMFEIPPEVLESEDRQASLQFTMSKVENPQKVYEQIERCMSQPEMKGYLDEVRLSNGRIYDRYTQPHRVNGEICGRVFSLRDVTEARQREEALRLQQRAIESSTQGVIIVDITQEDQPIVSVNPAFLSITGYEESEIIGKNCRFLQAEDREQSALRKLRDAVHEHRQDKVILRNYKKDGTLFWNELSIAPVPDQEGKVTHFVGIIDDITERRKMEEQLVHNATHDVLTQLPNRSLLIDRVQRAILDAKRHNNSIAMLFLDLDHFKMINDSLGHNVGDELLKLVTRRLLSNMRDNDTLARLGGDEFVAVITDLESDEHALPIAEKIIVALQQPFLLQDNEVKISTSMGVSFYPRDGEDVETLMKNADISMYQAKDAGRNTFRLFTAEMNERLEKRIMMEKKIRHAIDNQEFQLYYQPLIDLKTHQIIGFESLIRWIEADGNFVSPVDFIPLAEETGMIIEIGHWVTQEACRQNKAWQSMGLSPIIIAVNVSARQFMEPNLVSEIADALKASQLDPAYLEVELTETMLIEHGDQTIDLLHQLKAMGLRLAIDDFGTGYSSLNYLKQFPVDKLKIDRAFIKDIADDQNDAAITSAIIHLGHSLKLDVLAEGIEDGSQLAFLEHAGCDYAQGYYLSKPVNAEQATKLIEAQDFSNKEQEKQKA